MTGPDLIPVVLAENCDRRQWVGSGRTIPPQSTRKQSLKTKVSNLADTGHSIPLT